MPSLIKVSPKLIGKPSLLSDKRIGQELLFMNSSDLLDRLISTITPPPQRRRDAERNRDKT